VTDSEVCKAAKTAPIVRTIELRRAQMAKSWPDTTALLIMVSHVVDVFQAAFDFAKEQIPSSIPVRAFLQGIADGHSEAIAYSASHKGGI
jgi:hypothetical protein